MDLWTEGRALFEARLREKGVKESVIREFMREQATYADVRRSCEALKQDADDKYGNVQVGSQKVPTKWIQNVMFNLDRFIKIGDYMAHGAPESIGLAWWFIKELMGGIQNNYKLYGFFGSSLTNITDAMVLIGTYDRLYDDRKRAGAAISDAVEKLLEHIRNMYVAILDFYYSVKKHIRGSTFDRFKHAFKDLVGADLRKFEEKMAAIESLKTNIKDYSDTVFQEKSFKSSIELKLLVEDIREAQEASMKDSQETRKYLQELITDLSKATKPLNRFDWAKRAFDTNKKLLKPLPTSQCSLQSLEDCIQGTGDWIFDHSEYKAWSESQSGMLCITGSLDTGKSFIMSKIRQNLDSSTAGAGECIVLSVSCENIMTASESAGSNRNESQFSHVRDTLISFFYNLAPEKEDVVVLEECNKIFLNRKKSTLSNSLSGDMSDLVVPDLDYAFIHLSSELKKKVYLLIDGVDQLKSSEQKILLKYLAKMREQASSGIRTVVSLRSSSDSVEGLVEAKVPQIMLDSLNKDDIKLALDMTFKSLPGWTQEEIEMAKNEVLRKTGSSFKYAVQVAIPFLSEPWQRPLENRLKELPDGLGETYNQAIKGLSSNYLELLKTALQYQLLGSWDLAVEEVMDIYTGKYHLYDASQTPHEVVSEKENALELYRKQLKAVAGPFLKVEKVGGKGWLRLTDREAIGKHFLKTTESPSEDQADRENHVCEKCQTKFETSRAMAISEKDSHLQMALAMVRTLNSPLFQRRFLQVEPENTEKVNGSVTLSDVDRQQSTEETSPDANSPSHDKNEMSEQVAKNLEKVTNAELAADATIMLENKVKDPQDGSADVDKDSKAEENIVGISDSQKELNITNASPSEEDSKTVNSWSGDEDYVPTDNQQNVKSQDNIEQDRGLDNIRYEILAWTYYVRKAEKLMSDQERSENPKWKELMSEINKFLHDKPHLFAYQRLMFWIGANAMTEEQMATPVQLASWAQLKCVTEMLLDKYPDTDMNGLSTPGEYALLNLAQGDEATQTLKLLLERGANPNAITNNEATAFMNLVRNGNTTPEQVRIYLEHGADVSLYSPSGHTAMHYFALGGRSPEILDLLLEKGADINVREVVSGETPMHRLLRRNDLPLDLLRRFLERNADVNIDDKNSQRPLYWLASVGDIDALKCVIGHVTDVDDDEEGGGYTALHVASHNGPLAAVKILVEHGASLTCVDKRNRAALFFAKTSEIANYILDSLLHIGAKAEQINPLGKGHRSPLYMAALRGFADVVERLLSIVDPKTIDSVEKVKKRAAIHSACFHGRSSVVKVLLDHGASLDLRDIDGKTPAQLCFQQWALDGTKAHEDTTILLIEKRPEVLKEATDLPFTAASNGSITVLRKLRGAGIPLNTIDKHGWTPLLVAVQSKQSEAVEFLQNYMQDLSIRPQAFELVPEGSMKDTKTLPSGQSFEHAGGKRAVLYTNHPITATMDHFYFELTIIRGHSASGEAYGIIAIGLCSSAAVGQLVFPGWEHRRSQCKSWAYHGDDGGIFSSDEKYKFDRTTQALHNIEQYGPGDTVGCGIEMSSNEVYFTKNGKKFDQVIPDVSGRLFAVIGLDDEAALEVNLGLDLPNTPFKYNRNKESSD